jgi:hypothetical protein
MVKKDRLARISCLLAGSRILLRHIRIAAEALVDWVQSAHSRY